MLTKDDKSWIKQNAVSKDELKGELKRFATKEDLKGFATKEDLIASNVRLGLEFDEKIDNLKDEMNGKFDKVTTTLDKILKEVVKGREHDLVVSYQIEKINKSVFGAKSKN